MIFKLLDGWLIHWNFWFRTAFVLGPALIISFFVLLFYALFVAPSWYYSINARSEIVELSLPSEIESKWRIEGATLCSKVKLDGLRALTPADSPCDSWLGYALPSAEEQELELVLGGGERSPGQTINIRMEAGADLRRGLQVHITGGQSVQSLGKVRVDQSDETTLGDQIILIWSGGERPRDLVFPFTADSVTVGRDNSYGLSALLLEGKMEVFTASGESLSKRTRVEEAHLLPGDKVSLGSSNGKTPLKPKGFLRFDRLQANDSPNALTAVAFGRAESVRIERLGDRGYDFQPSFWARISHNKLLVTIAGILAGLLGLLGVHSAVRDIHLDWLPKTRQKRPLNRGSIARG